MDVLIALVKCNSVTRRGGQQQSPTYEKQVERR